MKVVTAKKIDAAWPCVLVGWLLTILAIVWQIGVKDASYSLRINNIEKQLVSLDERLDTAEEFRLQISGDLAEIKTDLVWIRQQLQENATNIRAIKDSD
jgi:hypothetical protein|tara:strand:- start:730 stop:1026 length:297 start_codon:yes stop_codon:yes gene_type:complete